MVTDDTLGLEAYAQNVLRQHQYWFSYPADHSYPKEEWYQPVRASTRTVLLVLWATSRGLRSAVAQHCTWIAWPCHYDDRGEW